MNITRDQKRKCQSAMCCSMSSAFFLIEQPQDCSPDLCAFHDANRASRNIDIGILLSETCLYASVKFGLTRARGLHP